MNNSGELLWVDPLRSDTDQPHFITSTNVRLLTAHQFVYGPYETI